MRLENKIALVTGAGKGIGKEIAEGFAAEGATVILNDLPGTDYAQQVVDHIVQKGGKAVLYETDVSKVGNIRAMFAHIDEEFGKLDVLVNNAGITGWSDFFDTDEALFDKVMALNLKGTLFCALEAAKLMKRNEKGGSIINISSICSVLSVKNLICYSTSKGGIEAMAKQMAVELAPYHIRVNTFGPGPINTDRNLNEDPDYRENWGRMVPMGRTGEPHEMIGPALFLASDASSYVTGQLFYVDGGWSVQGKYSEASLNNQLQSSGPKS